MCQIKYECISDKRSSVLRQIFRQMFVSRSTEGNMNFQIVQSVSWSLAEFRHNKIVQSPHENYFTMSTTQRKVRSREDDNYSNWVIINYGVY